jgi:hypothetical protein
VSASGFFGTVLSNGVRPFKGKTMYKQLLVGLALAISLQAGTGLAGEADVLEAIAKQGQDGLWRFTVTVQHGDEGWSHYANRFEVLDMDGRVLGTRVLLHPHEHEQPFTRSLGGVAIADGTATVRIRAGDSVHETGGKEIVLELPR